jgi:hypothetical protein
VLTEKVEQILGQAEQELVLVARDFFLLELNDLMKHFEE